MRPVVDRLCGLRFTRHMHHNIPYCPGKMLSNLLFLLLLHLGATTKEPQVVATDNNSLSPPEVTAVRGASPPCACLEGQCGCCTGFILGQLGYEIKQRGCMNLTYDPDDFAFTVVLSINDRVLYKNTLSGKNPRPACVSVPRVPSIKMCAVFSNVYFAGRNLHMCIDMEGRWLGTTVFQVSYDCIRIGANGVALLKPEDDGGLPHVTYVTGEGEDYDDTEEDDV